ncbi:hypothetical protein EC991_002801 [Linnemannia zychae]|nr:hypothetical protein EC991_002801 [Linnemannia zychae]
MPKMAATTTAVAAASVLALLGAKKVYTAITANRGRTLPSLRAANLLKCAYPEDYYPGGQYADLSYGETHYFMFGPEDGKKANLYSRGYSVGPAVDHDPLFYVTQLHELLKHVGWTQCNFVGLSLGGGIIASYAHRFPEAVQSLTFVAPGGLLSPSEIPWVGKIFLLPYSEEIFSHKSIKGYFSGKNVESMRAEFKHLDKIPASVEEAGEILKLQFRHHAGYARGLMSTLKMFPLTALRAQFATAQAQPFPVQIVWGTMDTVIPGTTVDTIQQLIPRIRVTKVEGATHSIVMTHPEEIIRSLDGYLV